MREAMREDNRSAPFRVVIVGGGTAGWMSAAGIRRQVGTDDYSVTLIESDEIGTVGVGEATLPHIKTFNDMLGVDEAQFMRETRATFKLGIQFRDWDQPGDGYIHPFGPFGESWGGVEFQHHWLRGQQAGSQRFSLQDYSYSVVAARNNAFEFPNEDRKSIRSTYTYLPLRRQPLCRVLAQLGNPAGCPSYRRPGMRCQAQPDNRRHSGTDAQVRRTDCRRPLHRLFRLPIAAARRCHGRCLGGLDPLAALRSGIGRSL